MPIVRMPCVNPGCGSDLVREDVRLVNSRTGKPAEVRQWPIQAALLIICLVALACVQLMRPVTIRLLLDVAVVVIFAGLSLALLALLPWPNVVARLVPSVRQHTYTCQICGYMWQTRDDNTNIVPNLNTAESTRRTAEGSQLSNEDESFDDQGHEKENNIEPIAK